MRFEGFPTEFYIPPRTRVVFVGDYFTSDLTGGAELTHEALLQACPWKTFRLHSHSLTTELIEEASKDLYWVLGNYCMASREGLSALVESGARYSFVEYDWKFCRVRAPRTCAKDKQGGMCPCLSTNYGAVWTQVFDHADRVFWMSEAHRSEYLSLVGRPLDPTRHLVQGSTWIPEDLDHLELLRTTRVGRHSQTWAVQGSPSWIKGTKETEQWCQSQNMPYEVLGGLPPRVFLERLSEYCGLVCHPADRDTCPRVVVEARAMGLDLHLNENVQHQGDAWWQEARTSEDVVVYLRTLPERFWERIPLT